MTLTPVGRRFILPCSFLLLVTSSLAPRTARAVDAAWNNSLPSNQALILQGSAYDPVRHRMLTFGGLNGSNVPNADLYALTLTGTPAWSLLPHNDSPHPGARSRASIVYDSQRDRLILYGGFSGSSWFRDVWYYEFGGAQTWIQLSPGGTLPLTGYDQKAVYDPVRDRLLVVSGDGLIWALPFSGGPLNWSQIVIGGTSPTLFFGFSVVYDAAADRLITYGGHDELDCPHNFDGCNCPFTCPSHCFPYCNFRVEAKFNLSGSNTNVWQILSPADPQPLWSAYHSAVWDGQRNRMVLFDGQVFDHDEYYDQVWRFDAGTPAWTQLTTSGGPPATRSMAAAVYDPTGDRMVVTGGRHGSTFYSDTWALKFDITPPDPITLSSLGGCTMIQLTWTAPGDDGSTGTATLYDVRRSSSPGGGGQTIATFAPSGPAGTVETYYDVVGKCSPRYYYSVYAQDDVGNWSAFGNSPYSQTACPRPPRDCLDEFAAQPRVASVQEKLELTTRSNPVRDRLAGVVRVPASLVGQPLDLAVFDVVGRRLSSLAGGTARAGETEFGWDLRREDGQRMEAGVYFLRLRVGSQELTRPIVTVH